jgi:VIT1/CCC1 family predicted Fe2+/Mn2+ transporter
MLIGILGGNLAGGIIDGVLYVLGQVFDRGRVRRVGFHIRQATSDEDARDMVAAELDASLEPMADEAARRSFYDAVVRRVRGGAPAPNAIRKEDVLGGLAAGWVVFACSFPALLPFLVLDDLRFALRISNAILIGLLFLVGWRSARHTLAHPWLAGLVFMLVGVLLVAVAIPLGG